MNQHSPLTTIEHMRAEVGDSVQRAGSVLCDEAELNAVREGARGRISLIASAPFDPSSIVSDRLLLTDYESTCERIDALCRIRATHDARLLSAREQTGKLQAPPSTHWSMGLASVGVFAVCFSPTIFAVFLSGVDDKLLAWFFALILGCSLGAFLCMILLPFGGESSASKRNVWIGIALGAGFGLLRLAVAEGFTDYLIAVGLTVIECAAVAGLDWYANRVRKEATLYRLSQAQIVATEEARNEIDERITTERMHCQNALDRIREREAEAFDVDKVSDAAAWAVEAAYRSAINANCRRLEGGAVQAFPMPTRNGWEQ